VCAAPSEVKYQSPNGDDEGGPAPRRTRWAMLVGRAFGWMLIIAAIAVLAGDISAWADTGALTFTATGELWFTLHSGSLNLLQAITQRYIFPALWDPIFVTVLLWPAFAVFGVPGLILSYTCRRRPLLHPKPA